MDRTQFTFYESFYKAVSRIRDPQARAQAYDAICAYALYGTEPDMEAMPDCAAIAFELIKPNLDSSRRKAENGKKGGSSKQTEANQSKPEANSKQPFNKKEKEGENKKEKEKEKENECYIGKTARHKYGQYSNVLLSDSDMEKLRDEFPDWEARIERLSEYKASTGKAYKNDLATIRNWARREAGRQPAKPETPKRKSWAEIAREMDEEEGLA